MKALLRLLLVLALVAGQGLLAPVWAQSGPAPVSGVVQTELEALVRSSAEGAASGSTAPATPGARLEVVMGQLDPRLRLAPCDKVRVYVPDGMRLWGRARVGLRCEQGPVRWNVYWPVTVKVWAPAVVAASTLQPGAVLTVADLKIGQVDLAEGASPAVANPQVLVGRALVRGMQPGQGIREGDLKLRRWFAVGDPVRLLLKGQGFAVAAEGTALSHGDEGRCARIKVESGRVLCGNPVGDRQAEVTL